MAVNNVTRKDPTDAAFGGVLKNVCSEGVRDTIFSSIYCWGCKWSLWLKGIGRTVYWNNTFWQLLKRFFFSDLFLSFLISNLVSCLWPIRTVKGFSTEKFPEISSKASFINRATDNENKHPTQICKRCYLHATIAIKRNTTTFINPFNKWNIHFKDNCEIYDTIKLPSKDVIGLQTINKTHKKHSAGRPTSKKLWIQSFYKRFDLHHGLYW